MALMVFEGLSIAAGVVNLVRTIYKWWKGRTTKRQLFDEVGNLTNATYNKYFNTKKTTALKEAYQELGLPYGTTNRWLIMQRYKKLAAIYHPDKEGGSIEKMTQINVARDAILEHLELLGK